MNLKAIMPPGATLTAQQQAAFYYARKRRRAREIATAAEFNRGKPHQLGIIMTVRLTLQ